MIALPLASTGHITPWWAAIGMSLSSLVVVLNAVRLGRPSRDARVQQGRTVVPPLVESSRNATHSAWLTAGVAGAHLPEEMAA
jgi:hypothetical protein